MYCVQSVESYSVMYQITGSGICVRVYIKRRLCSLGKCGNTRCITRTEEEHFHFHSTTATRTGSFKGGYLLLLSVWNWN